METVLAVLEGIGIFVVLPILIGLIIIGSARLLSSFTHRVPESSYESVESLLCSIDADCPTGYVCIDGQCIPHRDAESIISAAA